MTETKRRRDSAEAEVLELTEALARIRSDRGLAETKQRDRDLLERNRASVGLPPLTSEELAKNGLEETKWEVDDA